MKAEIVDLGERFGIEAPHMRHVARLALSLFDGFYPIDGITKRDRKLLFAAAYLHDIAYASDPQDHVVAGARILAANPIKAFTPEEWNMIIGVALLHKRDWRVMLDHACFPSVGEEELDRIKKLAAMLRIADGLDHGHIQDATIFYCRRGKKTDKIGVECGWYEGNISWAEGKADLWEAVFKRPFRFEGRMNLGKTLFANIVFSEDSAVTAARRILYSQAAVMKDHVSGMLGRCDPECLHNYLVAMRRFRTGLAMFAPILCGSSARILDDQMGALWDKLEPVCDVHETLRFFKALVAESANLSEIIQSIEKDVTESNLLLEETIESDECTLAVQTGNRFLRIELPDLERNHAEPPFSVLAKNQLEPLLEEIRTKHVWGLREGDPSDVEHVSTLCRKGRYYAEFAAPVLGKKAKRASKHLKTITDALEAVRNARLQARKHMDQETQHLIASCENEAWMRFVKGWRKLVDA